MHEKAKIGWNNEVVKRQTREQFVDDHPHIADEAAAKWDEVHKDDRTEDKPKSATKAKSPQTAGMDEQGARPEDNQPA